MVLAGIRQYSSSMIGTDLKKVNDEILKLDEMINYLKK